MEVGLGDLYMSAVGPAVEDSRIRPGDQVFPLGFHGPGFTQEGGNLPDQSQHLLIETVPVVDDPKMGMTRPGGDQAVVGFDG